MKELSIEEKARAYDEAIERANSLLSSNELGNAWIYKLLPELKESEDEKIRKTIIEHFAGAHSSMYPYKGFTKEQILAWLEKQGKTNMGISEATKQKLEDSLNKALEKETPESCNEFLEKQGKQKFADKVEPKFHEGDMIIHKELGGDYIHNPHKIIQVDILDKKYRLEGGLVVHFCEQDDYELVEKKPAWSEKDSSLCIQIQGILSVCRCYNLLSPDLYKKMCDWLKSLKDRYTWKPSDEQMKALNYYLKNDIDNDGVFGSQLVTLYQDLKKLREE